MSAQRFGTAALLIMVGMVGCREGTAPFSLSDEGLVDLPLPRRVTFSSEDDRAPVWSPAGDSLYYSAVGFAPFPLGEGILLSVPARGGQATTLFPDIQVAGVPSRRFGAPLPGGAAGEIAYAELWSVRGSELCSPVVSVQCSVQDIDPSAPRLGEVRFRVRGPEGPPSVDDDPRLDVRFDGLEFNSALGLFTVLFHPFHQAFQDDDVAIFRPSWDPDGRRLVFSDGLGLFVWEVGQAAAVAVPGTDDGVSPAWSPDGQWLVFTRLQRGAPLMTGCTHFGGLGVACRQTRTIYPLEGEQLELVRPDGSEARVLWEGSEAAWTPDGQRLAYRAGDRLWVRSVEGGGTGSAIPETEGGRDPAVSPDGTSVALARRFEGREQHDIWVVALGGGS